MVEYYHMALPDRRFESYLAATCSFLLILLPATSSSQFLAASLMGICFIFAFLFLYRIRDIVTAARDVSYALLALVYIPVMLMHLVLLRQTPHGVKWLIVIMLIIMTNDSMAYYSGRALGRHKLYPLVSPNKSIEGALGGLLGSVIGVSVARLTFFPQLSITDIALTAIFIGFIGQSGDLFESMLKRSFGVKDSGNLFPGHGGVLDRMDSIIFAAPVTYYYATLFFKG